MFVNKSQIPEETEIDNCDEHGEFKVIYVHFMDEKYFKVSGCPDCKTKNDRKAQEASRAQQQADQQERRQRRLISAGVSKRLINKTFDDYVATIPGQQRAKAKCEAFTASLMKGEQVGSLILNGGVGTGKTALCAAIASKLVDTKTLRLVKTIDLIRSLKESWAKECDDTEKGLLKYYSNIDLLIIDEIGVQYGSETEKLFLFDIIDGRYNEMKPTIMISNLGIEAIKEAVGERIIDRLREDGGQLISFDWESHRK